jgi:hypothetical protein
LLPAVGENVFLRLWLRAVLSIAIAKIDPDARQAQRSSEKKGRYAGTYRPSVLFADRRDQNFTRTPPKK